MPSGNYNHIPRLKRALAEALDQAVRKAALDVEARAKANCPVDTGACRASVFVVSSKSSDYAQASAEAQGLSPKTALFPAPPAPPVGQAVVAVGVEYGVFVELGAKGRAPTLFLTRAAAEVAPLLRAAMGRAIKRAAGGS